ncbi:hypothetical protein HYPSUDRAFT_200709 [Hypholoma sublateritium FD-334 SS-4]|uniref:Uncharacterized protein n=1 Tax=Hypholoma sublateritium (strain FD-334 SS-4) TaxID=945553 RepID=A0A0D2NZX6_HYPSF|nr:hypothetical protein HYPSUDRAFT_200709 [Hypholoma sublateritium FD-334 SS-4]
MPRRATERRSRSRAPHWMRRFGSRGHAVLTTNLKASVAALRPCKELGAMRRNQDASPKNFPVGPSLSISAYYGSRKCAPTRIDAPHTIYPFICVDTSAGVTRFARTPSAASWVASAIVYELSAALLVLYATWFRRLPMQRRHSVALARCAARPRSLETPADT